MAIETEWQSWVLSPFLVVLSHSKSHGFYSMPGSSSFEAAPPVNKQDLCVHVCACVSVCVCEGLDNMFHFLFVCLLEIVLFKQCILHHVYALASHKCTVWVCVPMRLSSLC